MFTAVFADCDEEFRPAPRPVELGDDVNREGIDEIIIDELGHFVNGIHRRQAVAGRGETGLKFIRLLMILAARYHPGTGVLYCAAGLNCIFSI
jgi:hypothetical protein